MVFSSPRPYRRNSHILPLLSFLSIFLISSFVRYLLGHAVATLLILEIARTDGTFSDSERGSDKQPLTFRSIYKAVLCIYNTQSLYTFSCALVIAAVYQIAHYAARACLEAAIFRHDLLKPFAHACSSILLCKLHLIWTRATISARGIPLTGGAEKRKWIRLAVPSFTYGLCEALMYETQSLIQGSTSSQEMSISTTRHVRIEIFTIVIMLAFRLLGLLPASITLILTEAKLLPTNLETVIPSPTKRRGSTIAELLEARGNISLGLVTFSSALKAFGVSQFLWLIELHLKKCCVQIAIELITLPIILFGILKPG